MSRKTTLLAKAKKIPPPQLPAGRNELDTIDSGADDTIEDVRDVEAAVTDNVGEQSIEINVENLIAELEAESLHSEPPDMLCARRKLEDYLERKRIAHDLEDFEDFEVED